MVLAIPAHRVVEVAGEDRLGRADDGARGLESGVDAVRAVVALRGRVRVGIDVDRVVGARLHARLATDAHVLVELDDAVVALVHRRDRADADARRVCAMVAAGDLKRARDVGERPVLDVLHPRPMDAERHFVLALTRGAASMTADTSRVVDDEAVIHWGRRSNDHASSHGHWPNTCPTVSVHASARVCPGCVVGDLGAVLVDPAGSRVRDHCGASTGNGAVCGGCARDRGLAGS